MVVNILLALVLSIFLILTNLKKTKSYLAILQGRKYLLSDYYNIIRKNKNKINCNNKLVMTKRAKRLYILNIFINIFISFISIMLIGIYSFEIKSNIIRYALLLLSISVISLIILKKQAKIFYLSAIIIDPIEKAINKKYYNKAKLKLESLNKIKVIGIAGSFGKTSTKFITSTILKEKFKVLETPESYNTAMGISKIINNELNEDYEIFIAELGARSISEVEHLTELLKPDIGIITSIGPVHLETFKNIDNIIKSKSELIEDLPTKGIAIFNYDNEYIKKLSDKTFKEKINYGMENLDNLDIYADNIVITHQGSEFDLKDKNGDKVRCRTKLLGKHNILNILAGASVAKSLGLTLEEIKNGISKIEPIEHRLNLIKTKDNINVIDDSYNSNPIGAKAALDVISSFREGKKIIVTPGMVNLGKMQKSANIEFGNNIAKVCDYVILIENESSKYVYEGILAKNYNKENIIIVENARKAAKEVKKIVKDNDIVLFESDILLDS